MTGLTCEDGQRKIYYTQSMSDVRSKPEVGQAAVLALPTPAREEVRALGETIGRILLPDSGSLGSTVTAGGDEAVIAKGRGHLRVVAKMVNCYVLDAFPDEPVVRAVYHPDITPLILLSLARCHVSLWIACYIIDEFYATAIEQCIKKGVKVCFVVDKHKLFNVAQTKERKALLSFIEWGGKTGQVQVRYRSPNGGMTSAQHEKNWLIDSGLLLSGSHNLTHNSSAHCEEILTATTSVPVVDGFVEHFKGLWEVSAPLEHQDLLDLIEECKAKKIERTTSTRSSASSSVPQE